jgi:hypothetical protein
VFIGGTERIVIFVDEPADAQDLIKCVSRSASKFPVHVTIVEVIHQDLPTNTDRHCEIAVSPYFADQELADMCKLLTKIYPESAAALDDLMHYVAGRAAGDHKAADRHLYVALLTASRGSFIPICDYVKKLHEQSLLADYPVLSLLSLLSAYAPRMGRLRESVSKCLISDGPSSAVKALCRRNRGFLMFQHAFLALVYIRIVTLRTIIAHASDAVDTINKAGTHEYDDKHATHLLSLRMKGNDFSLMINDCLLQSMSMNETFAVFDGPLGQKLDVAFANIVKSRLTRKHFGSDAEDSEIILLATRARDRLAGTKHSRLALSNLVEVYRYLVENGKKQYEVNLKECTQAYEEAAGPKL